MNKRFDPFPVAVSPVSTYRAKPTEDHACSSIAQTPITIRIGDSLRHHTNDLIAKSASRLCLSDETVKRIVIFAIALTFAVCVSAVLLANSDFPIVGVWKP
jgi:hypothetical protein